MKNKFAFSFLEVLVLIAVLIILFSGATIYLLKWIGLTKTKTVAEQLVSDLQWARGLALKYGSSRINFQENGYSIYAPKTDNVPKRSVTLPDNITINNNFSSDITFFSNTLPNKSGTITITGFGRTYKIDIDINGEVKLEVG